MTLRPEGLLLRVYDHNGRRIETSDELSARVRALEAEIARLRGTEPS